MRPYRNLKIANLIQHELSMLLVRDFSFDGTLVTVTDVAVDEDLLHAHVKLGIIPETNGPEVFEVIKGRRRELHHFLLKKLNIRPMPHLEFKIDTSK